MTTAATRPRPEGRLLRRLLTPEGLDDPYAVYADLRAAQAAGEDLGRIVLDHADVRAALADPRTSSDRVGAVLSPLGEEVRAQVRPVEKLMRAIVVFRDPPDHSRVRRVLSSAFQGPAVRAQAELVAAETARLVDRLRAAERPDLHAEVSYPLPALVVAGLLGIPEAHREAFARWALDLVLVTGSGALTPELALRMRDDVGELRELLLPLLAERRRAPGQDLLSALGAAGPGALTDDEVVANALFLMTAGHETATNQLSNAVLALLRHPEQLALLQEDPGRWPGAAEELIRYDPAVQITARRVTEDGVVGGREVRAGESLVLLLGAANRDPAVFADPDRLDVRRSARGQLGFGHGPHRCLGAALAVLELRVALPVVLAALPGLRLLHDDVAHQPTLDFRGPTHLDVAW